MKSFPIRSYPGLHFPAFGLNTERYWNTDTFYAVNCTSCKLCYTISWIAWGLLSTRNSLKVIANLLDTNDIIENDKNYHENFDIPLNWCNLVIYFRRKPSGFLWLALLTMIIKKQTWRTWRTTSFLFYAMLSIWKIK